MVQDSTQLPKTRVIKVKRKKKRVIRANQSKQRQATEHVQFMPQPATNAVNTMQMNSEDASMINQAQTTGEVTRRAANNGITSGATEQPDDESIVDEVGEVAHDA